MNQRAAIAAGVVALGVAGAYWGFGAWQEGRDPDTLTLYGNVEIREVELGFRVSGRLLAMELEEGDRVQAGDRLARLDPQPYRQALAAAEAHVTQAEARLERLTAGSRPQEVQQAREAVAEAQAAFENAERNFQRELDLLESGTSTQRVVDAARAQRDETAARLAAAREALALAEEGARREDIAAAQAALAAVGAQRDQANTQLADTELTAPSDGTILVRVREPGSMLAQGAPAYTLSLDRPVYVRAYVSGSDLGAAVPGATVVVTTDSSVRRYRGQIGFVSPRAEFTPRTVETTELRTDLVYRLRIVVADADPGLRQGMPVTVLLPRTQEVE